MNSRAFTLIEMILLVAIVGILAVSALPKFLNLSGEAEDAARDGVVGAVRSSIALYRVNDMVANGGAGSYPQSLESGRECCFGALLANPVGAEQGWSFDGSNYIHNGSSVVKYRYNPYDGTFTQTP